MTEKAYREALEWLYGQMPNYQIDGQKAYKPGLDNITKLAEFFGNPHKNLKIIHIAGTNGKGSTSNMLASVLQEAGHRVGLYNSPHLVDFRERIKINGEMVPREYVFGFIQKLHALPPEIQPSFFEFTTLMAFCYFAGQQVDFAIIETGLGGRLDATNIVSPLLTAITNVALDHTEILGDTIPQIAREKGGIIKPNIPIISGSPEVEVNAILAEIAAEKNVSFIAAAAQPVIYTTDLQGNYQQENLRTVQALLAELKKLGMDISPETIEKGLNNVQRNTGFSGRWQTVAQSPLTILDTGHNMAGMQPTMRQLQELGRPLSLVLGFVKGKDVAKVTEILPQNARYYFAQPAIARGLHPKEYEQDLKNAGLDYKIFPDLASAYLIARQEITPDGVLFIGGSNFIVGEFLEKNLAE